jgi:uncharacterized protein YcbX
MSTSGQSRAIGSFLEHVSSTASQSPADRADTAVVAVTGLTTTPVKGLRLHRQQSVYLGPDGVAGNRRFFLVRDDGRMVNGKQIGTLAAVIADYDSRRDHLTMTFPGGETVAGTIAIGGEIDAAFLSRRVEGHLVRGPWAAALSEFTGHPLRIVQADPGSGAVDRGAAGTVSLISRASVQALSQRADGGAGIDSRRFRMLIEVGGTGAHQEDGWVGREVMIGASLVTIHGHVGRCLVTGQNPETGIADTPTLDLLRSYRSGLETTEPLAFGVYGEVLEPGLVALGDTVRLV